MVRLLTVVAVLSLSESISGDKYCVRGGYAATNADNRHSTYCAHNCCLVCIVLNDDFVDYQDSTSS